MTLPASWLPTVGGAFCHVANSVIEKLEPRVVAPRQRVSEKLTGSLSLFLVFFKMWMPMDEPDFANDFLAGHVAVITESFRSLTGRDLIAPELDPVDAAREIYHAPFFVASHDASADPVLTYGNLFAQTLFDMLWDEFTSTPSRFTAEAPNREERARLLSEVTNHGFIDNYSGVRISASGSRFWIKEATVWNLAHLDGSRLGQAATFADWEEI